MIWDCDYIDGVQVWISSERYENGERGVAYLDDWLAGKDEFGRSLEGIKSSMRADGASNDDINNRIIEIYQEFQEWLELHHLEEVTY